jgi:hypothetical protein
LKLTFQADADLDPDIVRGLLRQEPAIDFRSKAGVIADGAPDSEVLRISADAGRVLVSRDARTMPAHFQRFIAGNESPGLLLIPSSRSVAAAIEGLLLVWLFWTPEDLRNQSRWLP